MPLLASTASRSPELLASGEVPTLPGTAREVEELDALVAAANWPHQRYTGAAAAEEIVRDVHSPRVLHIAIHGFLSLKTKGQPGRGKNRQSCRLGPSTRCCARGCFWWG